MVSARVLAILAMAQLLGGCWTRTPSEEPPPLGSYVLFDAATVDQGLDVIDLARADLPPSVRQRIEVTGRTGRDGTVMIRFKGNCAHDAGVAATIGRAAAAHGARNARCSDTLPDGH